MRHRVAIIVLGFVAVLLWPGVAESAAQSKEASELSQRLTESLRWSWANGRHRVSLKGRFVFDGATYDGADGVLDDGTEIRRNRISASARLFDDWRAKGSLELSGRRPEWRDAWVGFDGFKKTRIRLGQQIEPFGLNQLSFMEQALPSVLVPGYRLGASVQRYGRRWTATGGVFGGAIDSSTDHGWGAGGRLTVTPIRRGESLLHLGVAANYRQPGDGTVRFRGRPESHVTDQRLVNTGRIRMVESRVLQGLELAWVQGPFSIQSEYLRADLDREPRREDLSFDGWYGFASWIVTGESRRYRRSTGTFRLTEPKRPGGALEVALRYSSLDLDDGVAVNGGQGRIATLGLNWYFARFLRVLASYSVVRGAELVPAEEPSALQVRVELRVGR